MSLPEKAGIYFIKDINNEIIYIGQSINISRRINEHKKYSPFKNEIRDIKYILLSKEKLNNEEQKWILKIKPKYNKEYLIKPFISKNKITKKCMLCGKKFETYYKEQKYCINCPTKFIDKSKKYVREENKNRNYGDWNDWEYVGEHFQLTKRAKRELKKLMFS